jgi:hypothetical protein
MDNSAAQSIYRLEKERAMQERRLSHTQLMAEAKEAFNKLLADAQLARKGGRPRTNPLPPGAANRPPVKPPVAVAAAAPAAPVKAAAAPAKKAAPAHRTTDRGLAKASAKGATKVKPVMKAKSPSPKAAGKRAKPQPKKSMVSRKKSK